MHLSDSQPATSLYRDIAKTLISRIRDGHYAVGSALPREVDLSTEFGVSRATVREALRLVEAEHAVIRRRRAGTIVSGLGPTTPHRLNLDLPYSLGELTRDTRLELFARDRRAVPDGLVSDEIGVDMAEWLYFGGVRRSQAGDAALSMTEVYLHPRLTAVAHLVGVRRGLIYRLIEQTCGEQVRQVRTRMEPCHVSAMEAERLAVGAGSLATRMVQRIYNHASDLLEVAVGLYPAGRFVFDTTFDIPKLT